MEDLADLNLREALAAAAFFLPKRIRQAAASDRATLSAASASRSARGLALASALLFIHGDHNSTPIQIPARSSATG